MFEFHTNIQRDYQILIWHDNMNNAVVLNETIKISLAMTMWTISWLLMKWSVFGHIYNL